MGILGDEKVPKKGILGFKGPKKWEFGGKKKLEFLGMKESPKLGILGIKGL